MLNYNQVGKTVKNSYTRKIATCPLSNGVYSLDLAAQSVETAPDYYREVVIESQRLHQSH